MALVQLTDPSDEHAAPAASLRRAAGIDLGTTNTLAACVDEHGKAAVIADDQGAKMLPSVVHYAADRIAVGQQAADMLENDPANTIASVKRLMGRARTDIDEAFSFSFAADNEQGMLKLATAAGDKSPVEVSADILRAIQARACEKLGGPLEGAVITVPAYFDDAQRQATKDAASLAGLKVLRLLNEPTAAALAYGLDRDEQGMYAVYDLGGGTFDVSVLRLRRGVFEVVAAAGDSALGGDDYDLALARLAAAKAKAAYQPSAVALRAARRAKEQLASGNEAECALADGTKVQITRGEFEDACEALTDRTIAIMRACLKDKGIAADELDGVILVGGATRMPAIKRSLAEELGVKVIDDIDPDEAVAIGAAIQADMLIGNRRGKDWLLLDVISLSLGLETMGGLVERIIPRNSSIPIARAQEFTTHKDGQTAMSIHVVQGERDLVSDCRSLARFSLRGLPPLGAGAARILVTFQVDADGLLQVSAAEQTTGVAARIEVKPSYGLNADEIAGMLRAARENASEDSINRSLIEARNEAASIVSITRSALEQDRELAAADEPAIASAIVAVEKASAGQDADAVRQAVKQLNEAAEPFAQRRMEHAMKKALAGRDISKIT